MTSKRVTSFLKMTSALAVMTLWMTCVVTTAQVSSSTLSWSVAVGADHAEVTDEAVCRTRFLSSASGNATDDRSNVVTIAAILELRRPVGGGCGAVSAMELQTVAALFWAVRRLNDDPSALGLGPYIPGLRLELRVYDDCSHDVLAARHVGQLLSSHPDFNCTPATPPLAGFLGTTTSHTTSFVAGLLARTRIPHWGTSATVSVLSNSTTFPTFFRTVPSDVTQSKVLVDLVQRLQWTYVVGIYTRDNYGTEGFQEFKRLAELAGVCVFKEKAFWHSDQDVEDSMERFIRELLIELGNTRFSSLGVIYFGHDTEATILFKMIQDRRSRWHNQDKINQLYWLVSDGVGTSLTIASLVEPYTLLSISPATSRLQDVMDFFFHSLDNPQDLGPYWSTLVTEYLQEVQGCFDTTSPVSSCKLRDKIEHYDYLPAALDSFYSLAALMSRGHQKACGGSGAPGLCKNMSGVLKEGLLSLVQPEAMNYSRHFSLERLPAQFRQDRMLVPDQFGDFMPANSPLYFINFASKRQWTKIGEYCNGSLTFHQTSQLSSIPRSECGTDCQQCRKPGVIRYAYQPGDTLLLGLYSISSPPTDSSSFGCGDYRKQSSSVAALLAFLHSVKTLAAQAGSGAGAGGRRFGALVLDDCYNKLTASALLADLFSGKTVLRDPSSGQPIDMQKVVAVIGSQSSSVTLSALSLLTPLQVPSISYSATSPDLDDRLSYPYFLRPVPSDSLQARALVDLVKMLNITYVGALHQNNNYGWRGIQTFVSLAHEVGICVENPVPVNAGDSEVDLLQALRDIRNKDAKVVVVFLVEPTVLKLLDAIRNRNLDLIFLASEAWTLSTDTLHNHRGMTARGSLVLTVDTSREAGNIKMADYLKQLKTPALATQELPWMRDFWENEKQCNLPGGFTNSYTAMCAPDIQLGDAVVQELAGDQKVVQTINAVTSVTTALQQQCGSHGDPAACMRALPAGRATTLIRSVHLRDQNGQTFRPYLSNGNGNVGFALHNVQKTAAGTYSYVQVGRYHPEQGLQLQRKIIFYNLVGQPVTEPISSSCRYKLQCRSVCGQGSNTTPLPPATAAPPAQREEGEEGGLVAAVVVLALLCAALVALLVAMVCCAKRRGRIPFLGVVKRQESRGGRMPGTGRRAVEGETNLGFMPPILPRGSLPLPPVPGSSIEGSDHYIDPGDVDRRFSGSSGMSSSPRAASPALYDDRSHYDYAEGEGAQRRALRPQVRSQSQHQDLRRQVQELVKPQQHRFPSSPSLDAALAAGKDRPRARSVPRVDRPHFLPVQRGAGVSMMNPQEMAQPGRPRSYSHDAAFRARLGALSDDEQQILMKYMQISRQQDRSPCLPPKSEKLPPASEVAEEAERPRFFLQPDQAPAAQAQPQDVASPNAVFGGTPPPPFCSSSRLRLEGRPEGDPGLLYLHAVPTEKDLYLEVIADPSDTPPHPRSPPSHSPAVNIPTSSSSSSSAVSPVRASPGSGDRDTPSQTPSSSSVLPVKTLQSPTSVTSPLMTSVPRGSTASESSGAVFMSPDQEFPPLLKYSPSPKTVPPNAVTSRNNAGSAPAQSSPPQFFPVVVHEENRTAPGVPLLSSPTQQPLLVSESVQGRVQGRGAPSPASPLSTPQTSPQSAAGVPGMFVRDGVGNIFWLPGVMVPSSQQSPALAASSVSSASSPAAVVFPQGTGFVSPQPQFQRGDSAQASPSSASCSQTAMTLTPECARQTSVTLPPACMAQAPVTLTPAQNMTPTYRPPTPTTLTPASKPQNIQSRSKKPRMGVDSLSAQWKLSASDLRDPDPNNELLRTADPDSGQPLTSESTRAGPDTSTWGGLSDHPGSPQRTQVSGFGTAAGIPASPQEGVLRIVEQTVASPSPCKTVDSPEVAGSGGSNQTSGDSGTGEDLNNDAVNVDSRIEVCV